MLFWGGQDLDTSYTPFSEEKKACVLLPEMLRYATPGALHSASAAGHHTHGLQLEPCPPELHTTAACVSL